MPDKPRPIPNITDEAIAGMTGKPVHEWCVLLDCAGGLRMDQEQLIRQLRDMFCGTRYALAVTDRYRKARGMIPADGRPWVAAFWRFLNPWHYVHRSILGQMPAWAPPGQFELTERKDDTGLRGTWSDGSALTFTFTREDHFQTGVLLEITGLPDLAAVRTAEQTWRQAFEKLSALLDKQLLP